MTGATNFGHIMIWAPKIKSDRKQNTDLTNNIMQKQNHSPTIQKLDKLYVKCRQSLVPITSFIETWY